MADLWILLIFLILLVVTMGLLSLFARFIDRNRR